MTNHHPGNVFYRRVVRLKQESYVVAAKRKKVEIATDIVHIIRCLNPSGRFLRKDDTDQNAWVEIGDKAAIAKTSQVSSLKCAISFLCSQILLRRSCILGVERRSTGYSEPGGWKSIEWRVVGSHRRVKRNGSTSYFRTSETNLGKCS
jgi:hypothetical protein